MIHEFFWIAASASHIHADNPNNNKTFLATDVSMPFINAKPAVINGLRKLANPSWLVIFLVVPFNKISLFSKGLIAFMISFISVFVRIIPEPVIYSLLNLSICLSRKHFPKFLAISFLYLATFDKIFPKIGMSWRTPPNCTTLDNWVFENFILPGEPFVKTLRIFETYVSVNNSLCRKLVSSLEFPIKFDKRFKVTSVPFFIADFNLLSCELENFLFKVSYWVILY